MKKLTALLLAIILVLSLSACGSEKKDSDANGHEKHDIEIWHGPNCKQPKTCGVCGYTEGEIGDHSVKVGKCIHCDEFQNQELFDDIESEVGYVAGSLNELIALVDEKLKESPGEEDIVYAASVSVIDKYVQADKIKLKNILTLCGDYEELADIKEDIQTAIDFIPTKPADDFDLQGNKDYVLNVKKSCIYVLEAVNALSYFTIDLT